MIISGGTVEVDAGGDGLDSNGSAKISGGTIVVNGPTEQGNGALDVNGTFEITGGVLVAAGSSGMAVSPDTASAQAWVSVAFDTVLSAGTTVHLVSDDGAEVATFTTGKDIQSLVFSSSDIEAGAEYQVWTGGSASGDELGGLSADGDYTSGTHVATVTAGVQAAGQMGGPGGGGGGRGGGTPPGGGFTGG